MSNCDFFVPTRASSAAASHQYVVVEGPSRKMKPTRVNEVEKPQKKKNEDVPKSVRDILKMKQASKTEKMKEMFEIFKYAKSAMSGDEKLKADKKLIVKLGGVPAKKKYKNYKKLKEIKLEQDRKNQAQRELAKLGGIELLEQLVKKKKQPENIAKLRSINNKKGAVSGMMNLFGQVDKKKLQGIKLGRKDGKADKKEGKKRKK